MTIKEIYENVSLKVPLEQRRFIDFFNNSVDEITASYHPIYVLVDLEKCGLPVKSIEDTNNIKPLYHTAIIDNILFLSGQDSLYKSEFARKAQNAYLKYWEDISKNKIRKRADW